MMKNKFVNNKQKVTALTCLLVITNAPVWATYHGKVESIIPGETVTIENQNLVSDTAANRTGGYAGNQAILVMNGGSIQANANHSGGAVAETDATVILNNVDITANGPRGDFNDGAHVYGGGSLEMNGGSIHSLQSRSAGIRMGLDYNSTGELTGGIAILNDVDVFAENEGAKGISAYGSTVTMTGGSVKMGASATSYGSSEAVGIAAENKSHITLKDVEIETISHGVNGIRLEGSSVGEISDTTINTTKGASYALSVQSGSSVNMTDSNFNTAALGSDVIVVSKSVAIIGGSLISATGDRSKGITAFSGSELKVADSTIKTTQQRSHGVILNASAGKLNNVGVTTEGKGSGGVIAENSSQLEIINGKISTAGTYYNGNDKAHAVSVISGSKATLDGTPLKHREPILRGFM